MSFLGGTTVTGPRSLPGRYPRMGYPWPEMGDPLTRSGWGYSRMGYLPTRDGVHPWPGKGTTQDRTAEGVLAMQRTVCLLRSRKRTVLFKIVSPNAQQGVLLGGGIIWTENQRSVCPMRNGRSGFRGWLSGIWNRVHTTTRPLAGRVLSCLPRGYHSL